MAFNFGNYGTYGSLFGGSSSNFYNMIGDYSSIRTGGYKKLLKSYYAKTNTDTNTKTSSTNNPYQNVLNNNTAYANKALSAVKTEADKLVKSAGELTQTGSNSLFNAKSVTKTDETTGEKTTTKEYDLNAIASAVKTFVSDYNSAVEAGSTSTNANVARNTQYMTQLTGIYKNSLADVGITIGKDNTLSVNEDKLKSTDIDTLKKVFNGKSSFAAQTASRSSSISSSAARAATTASTYGSTGKYNNWYNNYYSSYNWYF